MIKKSTVYFQKISAGSTMANSLYCNVAMMQLSTMVKDGASENQKDYPFKYLLPYNTLIQVRVRATNSAGPADWSPIMTTGARIRGKPDQCEKPTRLSSPIVGRNAESSA